MRRPACLHAGDESPARGPSIREPDDVGGRTRDAVAELKALRQFVCGVEDAYTREELTDLLGEGALAIADITRELAASYIADRAELYERAGVFGREPVELIEDVQRRLLAAAAALERGGAELRTLESAGLLGSRDEERIKEHSDLTEGDCFAVLVDNFAGAQVALEDLWKTAPAGQWHAARIAEQSHRNQVVRVCRVRIEPISARLVLGEELMSLRGRRDLNAEALSDYDPLPDERLRTEAVQRAAQREDWPDPLED